MSDPLVRIGELGRRVGIPPATLRAWERRYGILEPTRAESGYRLYSAADEGRLRAMVGLITEGAAPAEAAARVLAEAEHRDQHTDSDRPLPVDGSTAGELVDALCAYQEERAGRIFDRSVSSYETEALLEGVVLPALRLVGERWSAGELSIGQEHYVSQFLRARLLAMARGWGGGEGPRCLLACPTGEEHDLGLVCFALLLRQAGWRITFLGINTPLETLADVAATLEPQAVVLALTSPPAASRLLESEPMRIAGGFYLGGAAADAAVAEHLRAELLGPDLIVAAHGFAGRR